MADDTPETTAPKQNKAKSKYLSLLDADVSTLNGAKEFASAFWPDARFFQALHDRPKQEGRKELEGLFCKLECVVDVLKRESSEMLPMALDKFKTVEPYLAGTFPMELLLPGESSSDEDASEAAARITRNSPSSCGGAAVGAASGHRRSRELTPDDRHDPSQQKGKRKK